MKKGYKNDFFPRVNMRNPSMACSFEMRKNGTKITCTEYIGPVSKGHIRKGYVKLVSMVQFGNGSKSECASNYPG